MLTEKHTTKELTKVIEAIELVQAFAEKESLLCLRDCCADAMSDINDVLEVVGDE